jgi:hypothetical protein
VGDHPIDEADFERLLGSDPACGQNQFLGLGFTDDSRQTLRTPGTGDDGEARRGEPHRGVFESEAKVAGEGEPGSGPRRDLRGAF